MKYLLLIYGNEATYLDRPREAVAESFAAYTAYTRQMQEAGVLCAADRLRPTAEAKTVRAPKGRTSVVDGPFAETKEQLGGYYLIEAPDMEAALAWAERCPGAEHGSIEVRPVWTYLPA
jgi:hypothetical protein